MCYNITQITTLNLSDNALNDSGIKHVTNVLQQNTTIKTLHLRKTGIGFGCSRYARYHFPSAPSGLFAPPVASTGGGNLVNFRSPWYLENLLKINSTLTTLHLGWNSIGESDVQKLMDALAINTTLKILDIGWNKITDKGAQHLADALKTNKTLTTLSLQNNGIGDIGAEFLANALSYSSTLTTLDLSRNEITGRGMKYFENALKNNTGLQTLDLWDNEIGTIGAQHLANGIKHNSHSIVVIISSLDLLVPIWG
ncbi:unnamed protein product [Rotaria sp. Silwood1]|nr:unnamed protein product [Rotaria sp. Silwood1]